MSLARRHVGSHGALVDCYHESSQRGPRENRTEAVSKVPISARRRRELRARSHHLKPIVYVGATGITDGVVAELEIALDAHELVKLRLQAVDRVTRRALIDSLCRRCDADLVNSIGHTAVLYRERRED